MPALPLDEAGKYVAAAYLVFLALILVYVAIMAAKLQRIDRELGELADFAEDRSRTPATTPQGEPPELATKSRCRRATLPPRHKVGPLELATKSRCRRATLPPRWRPNPTGT